MESKGKSSTSQQAERAAALPEHSRVNMVPEAVEKPQHLHPLVSLTSSHNYSKSSVDLGSRNRPPPPLHSALGLNAGKTPGTNNPAPSAKHHLTLANDRLIN
ncbi:unnamed protein product [Pleuronectes platessa]|uniref:Uncharacterized protein n=1 Tax=Pleuronectes platessa TaxID=8262 RepID=A0A9N7TX71_PLEPL|nr:unnamed protein product [Pleuronectes platessa]